jgi:WD40 repeat protein
VLSLLARTHSGAKPQYTKKAQFHAVLLRVKASMSFSKAEAGLSGHTDDVACLAVQPTASHSLGSGSEDSTVRLWDLRAAPQSQCISCISGIFRDEPVVSLAWHPTEEHRLLAAAGCDVCECDLRKLSGTEASAVLAHRFTANEVHQQYFQLNSQLILPTCSILRAPRTNIACIA